MKLWQSSRDPGKHESETHGGFSFLCFFSDCTGGLYITQTIRVWNRHSFIETQMEASVTSGSSGLETISV